MNQVAGSIRFNTDSSKLEIYNGEAWFEIEATSPFLETGGTRGIRAGGSTPTRGVITGCSPSPNGTPIDFITFSTTGNATDFGDTTYNSYLNGACSDSHGGLTL